VTIPKLTQGWMNVTYTSTPSPNPKIVYIYQDVSGTPVKLATTLSFTSKNQVLNAGPFPAGNYWVSTKSTYSTTAKSVTITAGGTATVSLSSSN
jgi:hypothetical protein